MKLTKTINKSTSLITTLVVILICFLAFIFVAFSMKKVYLTTLGDMSIVAAKTIESHISDNLNEVNFISSMQPFYSYMVSRTEGRNSSIAAKADFAQAYSYIHNKVDTSDSIEKIDAVDLNGNIIISSDRDTAFLSDEDKKLYKGLIEKKVWGATFIEDEIILSKPIVLFDQPQGYLFFRLNQNVLKAIVENYAFGKTGNLFLITSNKSFIGKDPATLPKDISDIKESEKIASAIKSTSASYPLFYSEYDDSKKQRYITYTVISNIDMVVAASIAKSETSQTSMTIVFPIIILILTLLAVFAYYRHLIDKKILHPISLLSRSLYMIKKGDLRARYNYNSDDEFGALSKTFNQTVSKLQTITENLKEREIKNTIILNTITDVIWEYNIKTKTITLSEKWFKIINFSNVIAKEHYSLNSFMYFFDFNCVEDFKNAIIDCAENETPISLECNLKVNETKYIWVKVNGSLIKNAYDEPSKIIGSFFDISDEKERVVNLYDSATKDDMTKLLKKVEFSRLVDINMNATDYPHFIIMADIDNFKGVNDTYGHLVGDEVVVYIAGLFRRYCDDSCYISRFGGDEFTLYTIDRFTKDEIADLVKNIILEINKGYTTLDGKFVSLSCSIGISQSPNDGDSYLTLLNNADNAIYISKNKTKNCYTFFS